MEEGLRYFLKRAEEERRNGDPAYAAQLEAIAQQYAEDAPMKPRHYDHRYEPGPYGVCRRCGQEKHPNP